MDQNEKVCVHQTLCALYALTHDLPIPKSIGKWKLKCALESIRDNLVHNNTINFISSLCLNISNVRPFH